MIVGRGKSIFGDDDARRPARRPGQRLERVSPGRSGAEVHRCQITGQHAVVFRIPGHRVCVHAPLRPDRLAARGIAHHAVDHLGEFIRGMRGSKRALQRVAVHAVHQGGFLLVRAGHAHQPFRAGKLLCEILGFAKFQVDGRSLMRGNVRLRGTIEVVSNRADRQRVMARLHAIGREAEMPLLVAVHAHRDRGTILPGAHHHAFHRPLFHRGNRSNQTFRSFLRADRHVHRNENGKDARQ